MPQHASPRFVRPHDQILRQAAPEVALSEFNSPALEADIELMFDVAYGEQTDRQRPVLVGLAAPQIGLARRAILVDIAATGRGHTGDLRLYLNPTITWQSTDSTIWYEGCYSTERVCGIVASPAKVHISAHDRHGNKLAEEHSGYTARILRHEIDHLNGRVFPSRISDPAKLHWVEDDQFALYRGGGWQNWPHSCPPGLWQRIRATGAP
jgi:peptide deformylase